MQDNGVQQQRAVNFKPVARERRNRIENLEYQLAKAKETIKNLSVQNCELQRQVQQSASLGGQMFYQNPVMVMPMQMAIMSVAMAIRNNVDGDGSVISKLLDYIVLPTVMVCLD